MNVVWHLQKCSVRKRHYNMGSTPKIKSEVKPLADVLREGRFIIPRYQRPYAWKPEHVNWLLEDIAEGINDQKSHHFLGPIAFVSTSKKRTSEINDGQQRIATFMLICAHLCINFMEAGHSSGENKALRILFDLEEAHDETMANADKLQPRIVLSTNDNQTYKSLTCGHSVKKNGQMNGAWKAIENFFNDPDSKYTTLDAKKKFFNFLLTRLQVALIEFKDTDDSITAFETQNTRGKPLDQIQLTCAYFFTRLRNDEVRSKDVHEQIDGIRTRFGGNNEDKFFDYVRCFAQCMHGHLTKERFCRDIRKVVVTADETSKFVRHLSEPDKIQIFQNLTRAYPDANDFEKLTKAARLNPNSRKIIDYLLDLREYKSVSTAIMFSLLCQWSNDSDVTKKTNTAKFVCKSSKLLASFFQRATHSFDRPFSPSRYDQHVSNLAMQIYNGKCKNSSDFLSALRNIDRNNNIIPDTSYIDRMNSISFQSKIKIAKYVLARINERYQPQFPVPRDKSTTEHILPKSTMYAEGWGFTRENHDLYVHRLGNLTLLSPSDNKPQPAHNANFSVKKRIYGRSQYIITNTLCDLPLWDVSAIKKRQAKLAKVAAGIWNFKT